MEKTLSEMALELATKAHRGQVDKSGADYIQHPMRVAGRMETEPEQIVGYLHDVLEDTETDPELIRELFGDEILTAVRAMTHGKDESWEDYLARVKQNPIARKVKISDLIDNSNLGRLKTVTLKDVERQGKYNRALRFLMEE